MASVLSKCSDVEVGDQATEIALGEGAGDIARSGSFVRREEVWRTRPGPTPVADGRQASVLLSRWSDLVTDETSELTSDEVYDDHVVTLRLRTIRGEMRIGDRCVWSGSDAPGKLLMTGPKQSRWTAVVHGRYDNLRVFLPQQLLAECYENVFGKPPTQSIVCFESVSGEDDALWQMMNACKLADAHSDAVALSFVDALGMAMASRLVSMHYRTPARGASKPPVMAKSSLRNVVDYIESHLAAPIHLADLSEIAGLSRFRLSREFHSVTGLAPYAYILRRRIERAKELLAAKEVSLVGVALEVGFGSQAHFTDSFRKVVGVTPGEWRKARP